MIIRNAKVSDLDAIMEIEKSSFISSIQEERSVFEQRIIRCPQLFLIFELEGKVCGYLSAELLDRIPTIPSELKLGHLPEKISNTDSTDSKFIYISSFALLPEARGNGNGKAAWNASMEYFDSSFSVAGYLLLVNEVWTGARKIYEGAGFREIVQKGTDLFVVEGSRLRKIVKTDKKGQTFFCLSNEIACVESGKETKGDRPFAGFFPTVEKTTTDGTLMIKFTL